MATYIRLTDFNNAQEKEKQFFNPENRYTANQKDFEKIPGSPIAYWVSDKLFILFEQMDSLGKEMSLKKGMSTGDNARFMKKWNEINFNRIAFKCESNLKALESKRKWFPINSGGEFRKWFGNNNFVVNWECNGFEMKENAIKLNNGGHWSRYIVNTQSFFQSGITWNGISSSDFGARFFHNGFLFSSASMCGFTEIKEYDEYILALLNSKVTKKILQILNPTLNYGPEQVRKIPFQKKELQEIIKISKENIEISKEEWDSRETSWDFSRGVWQYARTNNPENPYESMAKIEKSFEFYANYWTEKFVQMHKNEEELNRLFIEIYGLEDEMTPDVEFKDITLLKNETKIEEVLTPLQLHEDIAEQEETAEGYLFNRGVKLEFQNAELAKQLISYAIGCNMARYSIDKDGLIIANSDDKLLIEDNKWTVTGADEDVRHEIENATYIPDDDGIIPVSDVNYFAGEDMLERLEEFLIAVYGQETLEENLNFLADSLKKSKLLAREVLRDYFMKDFYEDHLRRYKKRPIYWMVSSNGKGKDAAFNAYIYLHRYNKNTIPLLRGKYVNELQAKLRSKEEEVDRLLVDDTRTALEKKDLKAEKDKYRKQINELLEFDKKLNNLSNQMIELDLDDGVKVNYDKLADILYRVTL